MESLLQASSATSLAPNFAKFTRFSRTQVPHLKSSLWFFNPGRRNPVIVLAKNNKNKQDTHSFVPKPDEATGPFPEAVLLKQKKVQEDGRLLPDFADEEEEELYEYLNLELESKLNVEQMRHYEVVYLIHEKHEEEVGSVNEKVQDFLREKKGRVWRLNDWGLRRLAYKIQKATSAHYILMNFELEARWINDFKTMLDNDERVIRHLVIKRDGAITEDYPPPPEWHTVRAGVDDYDEEEDDADFDDVYEDDGDWDDEEDVDTYEEDDAITEDGIIAENKDDDIEDWTASVGNTERKERKAEKIAR
ncbi:hypothetical protein SLA2020_395280 [Shorea laevis]